MRRVSLLLAITLLVACPAAATTLIPMTDADLVRSSALIVVGTVRGVETLELRGRRILTEVTITVERAVKGRPRRSKVVITEPGGRIGTTTAHVFGAPEFVVGERVLVFLRRMAGGRLRTNGLALGKYHVGRGLGGELEARRTEPRVDARSLAGFLATLDALAATEPAREVESGRVTTDIVVARAVTDRYTFLGGAYRWFESTVSFKVANAEATLGAATSQTVVDTALAAWTNVASSNLVLENGGGTATAPSVAGQECDGKSTIQFNDPFGEVQDLAGCSGVLAVGGFCSTSGSTTLGGVTFGRIAEADVTMNNGVGACFPQAANVAEVMTHELGHAIGLGHSSENVNEPNATLEDATMYFRAHFDGRGASVRSDDVSGVSFMYPGAPVGPDADGDGVTDAADLCPATPGGLAVDPAGCACADAGHSSCDDGSVCTTDRCDAATGRCVGDPIGCDDGEPCTVDGCDPVGGCFHPFAGDTDADGLCDPIDNCPRFAGAPGTDANGNGVGDACECGDARPGRCIPGQGSTKRRCHVEWLPTPAAPAARGLPAARLRCTDGDPACDTDPLPGQCTLRVQLCINNQDPRFPSCVPGELLDLVVTAPTVSQARDARDAENAAVLASAVDLGAQSLNQCSAPLGLVVPTGSGRPGSRAFKVRGRALTGKASARLKVTCDPAP